MGTVTFMQSVFSDRQKTTSVEPGDCRYLSVSSIAVADTLLTDRCREETMNTESSGLERPTASVPGGNH